MITYCDDIERISEAQLTGFFVGWKSPLTPERHLALLRGSTHFVAAIDEETHQVVGFITALSDGVSAGFIPLLEVLPGYQKRGIGRLLVERILHKLAGITNIDLTCDADMQGFYARFGMAASHGMVLRKYL